MLAVLFVRGNIGRGCGRKGIGRHKGYNGKTTGNQVGGGRCFNRNACVVGDRMSHWWRW